MSEEDNDPLGAAVDRLTPVARDALGRSLRRALGRAAPAPEVLAGDLINTDVEVLDSGAGHTELAACVDRAAELGTLAPIVRVDDGDAYALLVSPEHLWLLVDRVDELELAISALASACVGGLSQPGRTQALLDRLGA